MMPGVGLDGGALRVLAQAIDGAKEQLLHHHHDHEHDERERLGRMMRLENFLHAPGRDHDRGREHA